ncbi:sugar transferase [Candidatus Clostridium radicumherbarum]|uniref:Sugar transferase n=1 Tax=Candidatus Clostridium radicumherbarum TaxID=3381662 RepID=A0ABW8TVQ0_9CLOT
MEDISVNIDVKKDIINKGFKFAVKRVIDFILSIIGIILLSPVYLAIIIAIKLDSKGPVIFKQTRIGKDEVPFTIYKFRTMIVNAESKRSLEIDPENIENFVFQSKTDDRITKVGSFLRESSLDEIPQLFNVLVGNMSLVGPRPEIPDVVKLYPESYRQRLLVKPGITGLAQVSGRGEIELGRTVFYDLSYIKDFSLLYDFKIIFKTFKNVLKKEGAF